MITQEEKMQLAAQLRENAICTPVFDEDYLAYRLQETVEERMIPTSQGETRVYIHRAKARRAIAPVFINIHGGGFVRPLIETNVNFCSMLAVRTAGIVVDIDYKLAPEYMFPVAFDECYDVVKWVFAHAGELGSEKGLISLGGHSAGANLTASIALKANQTGEFRPCIQVMDFGAFDMDTDPADKPGIQGNLVPLERMRTFNLLYTENRPEITRNPYVSQCFAPDEWLTGLPEALIITGGDDCFRFEAEAYGARLVSAGVKVTMERFPDSPHGFTVNCAGKWREAQRLIFQTLNNLTQSYFFQE